MAVKFKDIDLESDLAPIVPPAGVSDERIIIFTEYRDTQRWLHERLLAGRVMRHAEAPRLLKIHLANYLAGRLCDRFGRKQVLGLRIEVLSHDLPNDPRLLPLVTAAVAQALAPAAPLEGDDLGRDADRGLLRGAGAEVQPDRRGEPLQLVVVRGHGRDTTTSNGSAGPHARRL